MLTVLGRRIADPTPGRYRWIDDRGTVAGFARQSLSLRRAITPMTTLATQTLVGVMSKMAPDLPGVARRIN